MPTFNVNIDSQIELITKSALATLVGDEELSIKKIYIVTNATATDDKRIVVIANDVDALSQSAINLTDNTFGTYDLGTDSYTLINLGGVNNIELVGSAQLEFGSGGGVVFNNTAEFREGTTDAGLGGNKGLAQVCSLAYELKWEAGRLYVMEQDGFTIRHTLYNFFNLPTANDDETLGYVNGSLWTTDDNRIFTCTDATTGAAVWQEVGGVQSVSGDGVDNSDPLNPTIALAAVALSNDYGDLSNLPTIPAAQIQSDWNQSNNTSLDFIKNKPTIPAAQIQSDWTQSNSAALDFIKNKPTLATVATSGAYNDLSGRPTLATVATSGSYADLTNKPKVSRTLNCGGSNTTFQAGTTYYFSPSYAMSTAFTNQQANFHKFVKGGTLKGFTYIWRTTQGNASLVITLQKGTASTNMADTAATLTVAANSAAGSSSSTTDITVNDGDFVTIKAVQSAGGNAGTAAGFFTEFEQQL